MKVIIFVEHDAKLNTDDTTTSFILQIKKSKI